MMPVSLAHTPVGAGGRGPVIGGIGGPGLGVGVGTPLAAAWYRGSSSVAVILKRFAASGLFPMILSRAGGCASE